MTRVTNFGRKRTYLEAGLATIPAETADPTVLEAIDEPTAENVPPRKKKRSKQEGNSKAAVDGRNSAHSKQGKTKASRTAASELRRQQRIAERDALITCFACRERGHVARNCPKTKIQDANGKPGKNVVGICYRCGSTKHTLSKCRKPSDPSNPFPFASCFVCSGQGHLASSCPQNKEKGVYPNGGCCKICGGTSHLAKDCELRKKDLTHNPSVFVVDEDVGVGADEDGFHVFKRKHHEVERDEKAAQRQVVLSNRNPPLPYEMSSRNFASDTFVEDDGSNNQGVTSFPAQEDFLHVLEPFIDAVVQLETLDKCVDRRHQSQRLALSMGIDVENNTEDSLPELEQINSVETLANDRLKVDMVLLCALHESSVLAKMSAHINELHHWMETNRNHVRRIANTLVKHYKSFNFPLNSVSSRIGDLLSEALAIRNKLEEKVGCEKKLYTQQSILQKRAASVVRSALEPVLADFRVQEENTWQEHKERFWQGLQKCMAPSIEMSEKENGQLVIMEMET